MDIAKRVAAACGLLFLTTVDARAGVACTLLVEAADGHVLHETGDCAARNSPASTFKVLWR